MLSFVCVDKNPVFYVLVLFPSVRKMEIHEDSRQMVTFTFSANEITVSFFRHQISLYF